jgi:3-oxoacid CoA-transferase subunit A
MAYIYLMGDIHGDWKPVQNFYQRNPKIQENENVLILLGDAGLNFYFNKRDEEFKTKLSKFPFTYFVIRGNHEERPSICAAKNPDEWHTELYFDNVVYVENKYPYIKYASDIPAVYNINGYRTIIFPGAFSVDKYRRLANNWSWFETEQMTEDEMKLGRDLAKKFNYKFDLVLSHTCPSIFEPTDLFLSHVDQSMVDRSMERYLNEMEYNLDYHAWAFGHFHSYRDYPRMDGRRKLMLFNDYAVELIDYMESEVPTKL